MCAKLCTVAASNKSSPCCCFFAPHIYGVVLLAHSVHGEPRIHCNASREVVMLVSLSFFTSILFWWMISVDMLVISIA